MANHPMLREALVNAYHSRAVCYNAGKHVKGLGGTTFWSICWLSFLQLIQFFSSVQWCQFEHQARMLATQTIF